MNNVINTIYCRRNRGAPKIPGPVAIATIVNPVSSEISDLLRNF